MRNISIIVVITFLCISLFADKNDELIEAAKNGDVEKVKQLIAQGADVNPEGIFDKTALMMAAYKGHTEIAEILIQVGADVNAKNSMISVQP